MKRKLVFLLALFLLAAFVLGGCGEKPVFGVSTNDDNSISVTADRGPKDSAGLGYLTVGENERVVLEAHLQKDGKIEVQMRAGVLGSESFSDEPSSVVTIVGEGTESFTIEPGEYTVTVKALNKVSGTALIRTETVETPAPVEVPDAAEETASSPAADDGYYSGLTAMPRQEVEAFAASVEQAYLAQDWTTISALIRYPITLYPDVTVQNAEEFLSYMNGKTIDPSDVAALEQESCTDMFYNGQGLCLGSGQVWILDPYYMQDSAPLLQIIALSGIVEAAQ